MSLEQKFNTSCEEVRNFKSKPSNPEMLELYSLYKQATVGDVNICLKKTDDISKAKYDAWSSKKGMKMDEAKKKYVAQVEVLSPKYKK